MILSILLGSILILFLGVISAFLLIHLFQEITGRAPFIPIDSVVLPDIVKALKLGEGSVLYDLGSGEGKVLFFATRTYPTIRAVGVERSYLPHFLARLRARNKYPNITFVRDDFFNVPVNDATHVFVYLFPSIMNALLPKLTQELKSGTRVVSCDFRFENKEPIEIIKLDRTRKDLGSKLYVYEF